jgi:Acetyltransferase (GNAT) domain
VSGNASRRRFEAGASAGTVETDRLLLVPWGDDQLGDFARICADVRVVEFITGGEPLDEADVREIHQRTLGLWRDHGYGPWAAFEKESGRWVGRVGSTCCPTGRDRTSGRSATSSTPPFGAVVSRPRALTRQGELEWRETKVVWYAIDRRAWSGISAAAR